MQQHSKTQHHIFSVVGRRLLRPSLSMDEATQSFNAVTGNDNPEVAKFFLESANQNVEVAINMFMESGGSVPAAGQAAAQPDQDDDDDEEEEGAEQATKVSVTAGAKDDEEQRCAAGNSGLLKCCTGAATSVAVHSAISPVLCLSPQSPSLYVLPNFPATFTGSRKAAFHPMLPKVRKRPSC
jgi:ribosomal protein L12E/L44/L45/RPP1/RPP2